MKERESSRAFARVCSSHAMLLSSRYLFSPCQNRACVLGKCVGCNTNPLHKRIKAMYHNGHWGLQIGSTKGYHDRYRWVPTSLCHVFAGSCFSSSILYPFFLLIFEILRFMSSTCCIFFNCVWSLGAQRPAFSAAFGCWLLWEGICKVYPEEDVRSLKSAW